MWHERSNFINYYAGELIFNFMTDADEGWEISVLHEYVAQFLLNYNTYNTVQITVLCIIQTIIAARVLSARLLA